MGRVVARASATVVGAWDWLERHPVRGLWIAVAFSVLLRLPSGQGWRLRSKGARATLEESVHLAGEARRSSQVVLRPEAGADTVQWAITRVLPASEEDA